MVAGVSATDVGRVLAGYEAVKRERCVIDLDDILLCAVGLLVQHRDITEEIRARYRHFVVDEYQDVSPLQHRLLELWFGDRNDVCVVGDPHQAIHSYAGARADYLLDFVADHPGAKRIDLVRNYRSTPEIVQLANEVLVNRMTPEEALEHGRGVTLVSRGRSGPEPIYQALGDDASEASAVAMWIESRHAAGIPWSEIAILYRINSQAAQLETALAERSIPYLVKGSERFYDRGEVRRSLDALARLAADEPGADPLRAFDRILAAQGWSAIAPEGEGDVRQRWESLQALHDLTVSVVDDGTRTLETTDKPPRHRRKRRATITVCSVCGKALTAARDRKLGHHLACEVGVDPALVERLRQWRSERAEADRVPAFVILTDATLLGVAEKRPDSMEGLLQIPGVGRRKADLYAADLIKVLHGSSDNQQ